MKRCGVINGGVALLLSVGGVTQVWAQTPVPASAPVLGTETAPTAVASSVPQGSDSAPSTPNLFLSKDQLQALVGGAVEGAEKATENAGNSVTDIPGFIPSYGDMEVSVLFSDAVIQRMKEELDRVERLLATGALDASAQEASGVMEAAPPMSAIVFQAYHVASIVYRGPSDWMVWLDGKRVTPKRNDGPVKVVGVGPDSVRLAWSPEDWANRMLVWNNKQELSADVLKIRAFDAHTEIDAEHQTITATMRSNQTWVTSYPVVVEGTHPELTVSLTPQAVPDANAVGDIDGIVPQQAQPVNTNAQPVAAANSLPPEAAQLQDRRPTSLNDILDSIGKTKDGTPAKN